MDANFVDGAAIRTHSRAKRKIIKPGIGTYTRQHFYKRVF